ncbi:hypothetical protein ACFS07_07195 [Undibacterium arcticum]
MYSAMQSDDPFNEVKNIFTEKNSLALLNRPCYCKRGASVGSLLRRYAISRATVLAVVVAKVSRRKSY